MGKDVVTSIRIDGELWKETKLYAVKNDTTLGELVERLLRQELAKSKGK